MNIAFYIDEMNLRGVANSTFEYAKYNRKILKNSSFIFYNKKNYRNRTDVIKRFKLMFKVIAVSNFNEIDAYIKKFKLNFIYTQKSGKKDLWVSKKIKTLVHSLYPQKLSEIHGYKYFFVSTWLCSRFSNNKMPYLPYIVSLNKTKKNLKKKLKLKKQDIIFGCYGGDSSFDLKFVQDTLVDIVKKNKNISFIFMNINKFCNNPRIKFLKGTTKEILKKKFINTCDGMIYARSLGESFGLACAEFANSNKPIISYRFNRHRAHIDNLSKSRIIEYSSRKDLSRILINFNKNKKILSRSKNNYINFKPNKVMKIFNNFLEKKEKKIKLNIIDHFINYINFSKMNYFYIRHKFYQHYYNFFEKKIFYSSN
ncbi:MAG: hypothetical protein FD550_000460 [Pelagibacterales bacterium]|jgi:hypothetical protein|nr:hypothetical protein [Pelagibacterales bacterium]